MLQSLYISLIFSYFLTAGSSNPNEAVAKPMMQPPFHNFNPYVNSYCPRPAQPPFNNPMTEFPWLPVSSNKSFTLLQPKPSLAMPPRLAYHRPRESVIRCTVRSALNCNVRIPFKEPEGGFFLRRSVIQPSTPLSSAVSFQQRFENERAVSVKQEEDRQVLFQGRSSETEDNQSVLAFHQVQHLSYSEEMDTKPNISSICWDPQSEPQDLPSESAWRVDQGREENTLYTDNLSIKKRDTPEEMMPNETAFEEGRSDDFDAKKINNFNGNDAIDTFQTEYFPDTAVVRGQRKITAHDHRHCPMSKKKHVCDECGRSFTRSSTLITHKRIHTGDKPYVCQQCGRAFRQLGNLYRHQLTHTNIKPYICQQCNKAFNRASNLHTHMRTHSDYKPFSCDFCGKQFYQKIDMKIHRYTHTGEKAHKCLKCGRGFKQLTHLTYHMRTHSDVRIYKCEFCGKGFNQKGNLKAHVYRHTGERPFKCDICGKGFTMASTLNTHKKTHAPHKPFQCQYCEKAFYQKNTLKSHYIASHPFTGGNSLL